MTEKKPREFCDIHKQDKRFIDNDMWGKPYYSCAACTIENGKEMRRKLKDYDTLQKRCEDLQRECEELKASAKSWQVAKEIKLGVQFIGEYTELKEENQRLREKLTFAEEFIKHNSGTSLDEWIQSNKKNKEADARIEEALNTEKRGD